MAMVWVASLAEEFEPDAHNMRNTPLGRIGAASLEKRCKIQRLLPFHSSTFAKWRLQKSPATSRP